MNDSQFSIQNSELETIIEDKTISLDENNFIDENEIKNSIKNIQLTQGKKNNSQSMIKN